MKAYAARTAARATTQTTHAPDEPGASVLTTYLAPLFGGFAIGAGIGVLLWHLV